MEGCREFYVVSTAVTSSLDQVPIRRHFLGRLPTQSPRLRDPFPIPRLKVAKHVNDCKSFASLAA